MSSKTSKAERLRQLVRRLMLDGNNPEDIRDAARSTGLASDDGEAETFTRAEVERAVAAVREGFQGSAQEEVDCMLGWTLEAARDLYRQLVRVGDYAGALRAADQVRKLAETKDRMEL